MKKPNLFNFATSELSQDAFICWLLSWAKPECKDLDQMLHGCSIELLRALFEKCVVPFPDTIEKVQINKQDSRIDVFCEINKTYFLVIEDKTNTSQHSGQLERYFKEVAGRERVRQENILLIYFKTGDQSDYDEVQSAGYALFLRKDLLSILNKYEDIESDIFQDYRASLNELEAAVQSFRTLPLNQWHWHSWIGFYLEMQKYFPEGKWGFVPNRSGGFLGFWFSGNTNAYLQMEQEKFCFKITVGGRSQQVAERWQWHEAILAEGTEAGFKLKKPDKFGRGTCMTVCVLDEEYRKTKSGVLDLEATVAFVSRISDMLRAVKLS